MSALAGAIGSLRSGHALSGAKESNPISSPSGHRAGRREWIGLAVIALPCLFYSMDLTVLNLAVPALTADLQPSSTQLLWILDIYGFLVAGSLITMGTLGDRIGRRRLLMFGAAAFAITSVIAAMSTSAEMLIGTRALLGLAGATLAPSTLSLIRNMFLDPDERTFAIGVWITSYSAGGAIGPILGGIVLEHFPWGVVFLLGVPVMLLPEYRDPDAGRPDLVSAGMSLISVLLVIYGIKRFAEHGPGWLPAASILAGLGVALGFVRRQRRLADPLIDLQLFKSRAFSASLATYMLGTVIAFGAFFFLAQYLQMVLGLSPLKAGFGMLPFFCGFIAGTLLVPAIVRRVRPGFAMAGGLVLAAIGFVILSRVTASSGLLIVIAGSLVFSLGLSPVFTLATDLVVGNAPPERAGAAAAISETSSELGGALGIAILGSIGAAVYRGLMADAIPAGVPAPAAAVARSTLGGALAEAARLPGALGAELVSTSRDAFMRALELTATISAVIALGSAILAAVLLREVRR